MNQGVHVALHIKNDLGMPNGKLCAQVAHGISLMVLNLMQGDYALRELSGEAAQALDNWIEVGCPVETSMTSTDDFNAALKAKAGPGLTVIEDHGRTVFDGVKTVTVAVEVTGVSVPALGEGTIAAKERPAPLDELRQLLLVDTRSKQKLDSLIAQTVRGTVAAIYHHRVADQDGKARFDFTRSPMGEWLDGGFAKIVLSSKDLDANKTAMSEQGMAFVEVSPGMVVSMPSPKSTQEVVTQGMRLL